MKNVLLLSPVEGRDAAGGDRTYTYVLRDNPPPGVRYETYDLALERGALRERGTGRALREGVQRARALALGEALSLLTREASLTAVSKTIAALRLRQRLFWEPFLWFEVKAGEYDLVHAHIFSARFENLDCPLVVSLGGRLRHLYLDARHFSPTRVKRLESLDRALARVLGVNATSQHLPQAARMYTFTLSGRDEFRAQGILPADKIEYIPFHLPTPTLDVSKRAVRPCRVGFVAREFVQKGGPLVLRAWDAVLRARPDAQLWIVGNTPPPGAHALRAKNVTWIPFLPREQLLNDIMPSLDVFTYPTTYDYLPCYTLMEAMARGVPVVGNDHRDMDVTLGLDAASVAAGEPPAGLICSGKDSSALARNILRLLNPDENARFRAGARAHFERTFSCEAVWPQLNRVYDAAKATDKTERLPVKI